MQIPTLTKQRIDWPAVHLRLQANQRALEQSLTPTPQRIDEALRRRAIKLAQAPQVRPATPALPVLVFCLAPKAVSQELYAIEMKHLAEVLPLGYCAPVPRAAAHFLGAIGVRGELRAVVDLRRMLEASSDETDSPGFVLMLRAATGSEQIGLKVDSIEGFREIRPEELTQPAQASLVIGLAPGPLIVLSVDALLKQIVTRKEFPIA